MMAAYELGKSEAMALKIGDTFKGSMPEAEKHYGADSIENNCYQSGYLEVLKGHDLYLCEGLITGFTLRIKPSKYVSLPL